ncbi:putative S-locus glycoprotein [Helianthus anomalus]
MLLRVTLNSSRHLESWACVEDGRGWQLGVSYPQRACDTYNICNAYGICNSEKNQ